MKGGGVGGLIQLQPEPEVQAPWLVWLVAFEAVLFGGGAWLMFI